MLIFACEGVKVIPEGPPEGDMAIGRVEMAVREVKRQCRTLRSSAEQDTCVRFSDVSPLLRWLPRCAAKVMNKMRIGKDGKTSEVKLGELVEDGESQWRNLERKLGFGKIGEDGVSSCASRRTQGIFVGHHDRTRAVLSTTKNGVVRCKSWTRRTLSDAWESTNWGGLCVALTGRWWLQN